VLVVFASAYDAIARSIVAAWTPWNAALCTPADLSIAGWRHYVLAPERNIAVVAGRVTPVTQIAGALTRLPTVQVEDLPHIAAEDRDYAAAEMTAFLSAFLSALPCPTLNRPSGGALTGPAWRLEQWICVAAGLGIPVRSVRRHIGAHRSATEEEIAPHSEVIIIGDRTFGDEDERLRAWARALARITKVGYLAARFACRDGDCAFVGAEVAPRLQSAETLEAARRYLMQEADRSY
jgi:hypothetical protein